MMRSPQGKAAVHSPKLTAAFQTSYAAHLGEHSQCAIAADPMEVLRGQYAAFGLGLYQMGGMALLVTGPGVPSRTMPDARCAWLYLRQLRGAV